MNAHENFDKIENILNDLNINSIDKMEIINLLDEIRYSIK